MFKRLSPDTIVNLENVCSIQLQEKSIVYEMCVHRAKIFAGSGSTYDIIHRVKYTSNEEAKKAFEQLEKELGGRRPVNGTPH
jgi:hypothetical protein